MKRARRILAPHQRISDVLEDRFLSEIAGKRLQAIRDGGDELLDEEDFWACADRIVRPAK